MLKSAPRELWLTFAIKFFSVAAYGLMNKTLVLWLSYFGILWFGYGVGWERNVWLSGVLLAGLSGVLMSSLLVPAQPAVAAADLHLRSAGAEDADQQLAA